MPIQLFKSDEGQTAADMAAQNGNKEVLEFCSRSGAASRARKLLRLSFVSHRPCRVTAQDGSPNQNSPGQKEYAEHVGV